MSTIRTPRVASPAIVCIIFGSFAAFGAGISLIFLIRADFYDVFGIAPFVGPMVFFAIALICFILAIYLHVRFKRGKLKFPTFQPSSDPYDNPSPYSDAYDTTSLNVSSKGYEPKESAAQSTDHHVDWEKIAPLIFKGKLDGEICPICKLELKQEETILQCPNCPSLFHDQHFIEWILNNETCPTCFAIVDVK